MVTIGSQSGGVLIDSVAPGLYSVNGRGTGAAEAMAATHSEDGAVTAQDAAARLDLGGPTDRLILTLYGTGLSGFSGAENVAASVGGAIAEILYIGPHASIAGRDQVDLVVPRSLAGVGESPIVLTVDGQTANALTIRVR